MGSGFEKFRRVRVAERSPTRLRLAIRYSHWLSASFWTAALVGLFVCCPSTAIFCARETDGSVTCKVQRQLFGLPLSANRVTAVMGANVGSPTVHTLDDPGSAVFLLSRNGLTRASWGGAWEGHRAAVAELNRFCESKLPNKTTVVLRAHPLIWAFELLYVFCISVAVQPTRVCIDKTLNVLEVVRPGIGRSRRRTQPLSDVASFAIVQRYSDFAEDPLPWMERHCPNLLEQRKPTSERTVLVLVARLRNGKEMGLMPNFFGGERGLKFVRELEAFLTPSGLAGAEEIRKPCAVCGAECDGGPRLKDDDGRYYHATCYQARVEATASGGRVPL